MLTTRTRAASSRTGAAAMALLTGACALRAPEQRAMVNEPRNTPVLDGTTEQAEQPITNTRLPAMVLKDYGVNPTIETTAEPTSTFAADVDTGSYTLTRGYLERGVLPDEAAVRVEEFVVTYSTTATSLRRTRRSRCRWKRSPHRRARGTTCSTSA